MAKLQTLPTIWEVADAFPSRELSALDDPEESGSPVEDNTQSTSRNCDSTLDEPQDTGSIFLEDDIQSMGIDNVSVLHNCWKYVIFEIDPAHLSLVSLEW